MFRDIRKVKNIISEDETKKLLKTCKRGALSVNGDDGYPYVLPINFYYEEDENRLYFHSGKSGYKIESVLKSNKVSFTVWDEGYLEEDDWAYFVKSAILFGKASLVKDEALALEKLRKFAYKYYPTQKEADEEIELDFKAVQMIALDIEHLTGKKIHEK